MVGSLTGAVSSQSVTEEFKGTLSPVGNRASSVKVEGCLTASGMPRAETKVGLNERWKLFLWGSKLSNKLL